MGLTRGQVLIELERRGELPADLKQEVEKIKSGGDRDFLASLPADRAAMVQAVAEGRVKPPTASRGPGMALLQDVAAAYPGFDAGAAAGKFAIQTDAAKGKLADSARSLNTAIGHLDTLAGIVDRLGNATVPLITQPYNYLKNKASIGSGGTDQRTFGVARQAVADELETTFRGGRGGTEKGTRGWAESLNLNDSPEQQRAAIAEAAHLLQSRIDAINSQYGSAVDPKAGGKSFLTPDAESTMKRFASPGFITGGPAAPPPASGGPGGGSGGPGASGPVIGGPMVPGAPPSVLATGGTKDVLDPQKAAQLEAAIRGSASPELIERQFPGVSAGQVNAVRAYIRNGHAGYRGFASAIRQEPTTTWEQIKNNPVVNAAATTGLALVDGATLGGSDEIAGAGKSLFTGRPMSEEIAGLNRDKEAAFAAHPGLALAGQTAGMLGSAALIGGPIAGIAERALPGFLTKRIVGDTALGMADGALGNNDNRTAGAVIGGIGGAAGNLIGQGAAKVAGAVARTAPGVAFTNAMADRFGDSTLGRLAGLQRVTSAPSLSPAEQAVANAATKAGPDSIITQLAEADTLGVPMSLADTHPEMRELAGAAVRHSPTASSFAEDNLIPRSRGQYDRFVSTVDQNLGPTANIPQRSADLTAQARAAAGPLYDKAYAAPVITTPELEATLNTPFGRQALARARTIAANERRDPMEMGFAVDPDGNVVLNPRPNQAIADHLFARQDLDAAQDAYRAASSAPGADVAGARSRVLDARQRLRDAELKLSLVPDPSQPVSAPGYTTQTLDYVKRGMDDVLEDQRNPLTGKLVLDEAGCAQDAVRKQFLAEVDKINPAYADARAAYAGPAAERSNMAAGQQAYTANPQQLAVDLAGSSPERLGQMQLGYQGALVDHAGRVRDSANPWEVTLGSPMARDRLGVMFPEGTPGGAIGGVPHILRQRDLEGLMQGTTNTILGGSRTARNQIADQAFELPPIIGGIVDAGAAVATHGASLPATLLRLGGTRVGDTLKLGVGSRAVAKADDMAPILMTPDAVASSDSLTDILARLRARQGFVDATTPTGPLTAAGAAFGANAAVAPLTYRAAR